MLKLEKRPELDSLHSGQMKESLTLEYKSSDAVDKSEQKKQEMAKDALAFANAAGGQIIYGMREKDNLPQGLDGGVDPLQFPGIWFEQVIQQNVSPQIEGLRIHEVSLEDGTGRVAVVITIPAGESRVPHQAKDGRYYRRHNFRNQIMEDYEVRDMMGRQTTAKPYIEFTFPDGRMKGSFIDRKPNGEHLFRLTASLCNRSRQPAYYAIVTLFIDKIATLPEDDPSLAPFTERTEYRDKHGNNFHAIRRKFGIPGDFPIFQEARVPLCVPPLLISLDYSSANQGGMFIGYEILTPGHLEQQFGIIHFNYGQMTIKFPANIS